jgi:hypothetical protein
MRASRGGVVSTRSTDTSSAPVLPLASRAVQWTWQVNQHEINDGGNEMEQKGSRSRAYTARTVWLPRRTELASVQTAATMPCTASIAVTPSAVARAVPLSANPASRRAEPTRWSSVGGVRSARGRSDMYRLRIQGCLHKGQDLAGGCPTTAIVPTAAHGVASRRACSRHAKARRAGGALQAAVDGRVAVGAQAAVAGYCARV